MPYFKKNTVVKRFSLICKESEKYAPRNIDGYIYLFYTTYIYIYISYTTYVYSRHGNISISRFVDYLPELKDMLQVIQT